MLQQSLISIIFFLYLLPVFAQDIEKKTISIDELKGRINSDSTLVILDVRTPEELAGPLGKLDNVINIPVQELEGRISELDEFRDMEIAVICRTGRRSATATDILIKSCFNAKNVGGGMLEYRSKTENSSNPKE